jgi:hypothetical protein
VKGGRIGAKEIENSNKTENTNKRDWGEIFRGGIWE